MTKKDVGRAEAILAEDRYRQQIKPALEASPCAAYIVKKDIDFTFIEGDSLFYDLIGFSQEELAQKFGYRLGAFLDGESLQATGELAESLELGMSGAVNQRLVRKDEDFWMYTRIMCCQSDVGPILSCMSFDISSLMFATQRDERQVFNFETAAQLAHLGAFEYDLADGSAQLFGSLDFFPSSFTADGTRCPHFLERLLAESVLSEQDAETLQNALSSHVEKQEQFSCELRIRMRSGEPVWARVTLSTPVEKPRQSRCLIGVVEDITHQKESAIDYLRETQFFQAMLTEHDAYGQIDVSENRIMRAGGMWNLYNEIIDTVSYTQLFDEFIDKVVHPDDRQHYKEFMQCANFIESLNNGIDSLACEFRRIVDQNKMAWMKINAKLFIDPLSRHVFALLSITNIEAQKRLEFARLHDSTFDQLTDIYNKKTAQASIIDYLKDIDLSEPYAFMIIDFDNLKEINDSQGHEIGDRVLIKLANILNSMFRKNDIVGRFGGDEFILLIKGVSSHEQVDKRLDELDAVLAEDTDADLLSCCIGIVCAVGPVSYEHLFRHADIALYEAKLGGRGQRHFFDEEKSSVVDRRKDNDEEGESASGAMPESRLPASKGTSSANSITRSIDDLVGIQGDIAYLVDVDDFSLICGNRAFYDRVGLTEQQCRGKKCYEVMHHRESPCPFCGKTNWATDKFYIWKNYNLVFEQEFLIKNKLVAWNEREVLLALAVDISNNKSIVDSLETGSMEMHAILEGVQRMTGASSLEHVVETATETVGTFFRAERVRYWHRQAAGMPLECVYQWPKRDERIDPSYEKEVDAWVESMSWERPVDLESPEAMLCHSYAMYQHMKSHVTRNQRWLRFMGGEGEYDFISIDGLTSNLQNVSFLSSFVVFLENELKQRMFAEKRMRAILHDDLTDLLSRRSFETFVTQYQPDQVSNVGVIVANIDNLKRINESHSYQTGSRYIKQFAEMFQRALPDCDTYRLDGDEFLGIALNTTTKSLADSIKNLELLINENSYFTVSVGSAWDDVEKNLRELVEQATEVMQGGKQIRHDSLEDQELTSRRKMLNELLNSIDRGDFKVFLQPKVDLETKKIMGAEALIRFENEEQGVVAPGKFIDILEKNDLIRYIDLFVLDEVCKLLEDWRNKGYVLPVVSLNFSRYTLLERDIAASVETIVGKRDVSRHNIEIEITESASVIGKSVLYQAAQDLYRAGYSVSLDDFGTKYTNLSVLADIDFNVLKIDRSLVNDLETKKNYSAILRSVIEMCEGLGIKVIAEGIETKEQEKVLRSLGCKYGQGYLYGKPMPVAEFVQFCFNSGN